MRLIRLSPAHEAAYADFVGDWRQNGEDIVPFTSGLRAGTFADYVQMLQREETDPPAPLVRGTTFFLEDNGRLLGAVNIRHTLNERLLLEGGHIGYGVRPGARGRGLAAVMVRLTFPFLRELGITGALITCDDGNAASAKTIERLGGRMENKALNAQGVWVRRYWLDIPQEGADADDV